MPRRTCPTCPKRYAGLVDTQCPVCEGVGVVALGAAALERHEPAVVARTIELYLESASREAANHFPPGDLRLDALAIAAQRLRVAGVMGAPLGVAEAEGRIEAPQSPETRVADWEATRCVGLFDTDVVIKPSDLANIDAEQTIYGPDDRPHASGLLPSVSADGWPSAMVKAADPRDALGASTRAIAYARQSADRTAQVVANAVDRAIELRTRRASPSS